MNLERAIERASCVPGPRSAARLYNDIEYELALGEPSDTLEDAGERALTLLEGRFPGVRRAAREIEQPPSISRRGPVTLYTARVVPDVRAGPLIAPRTTSIGVCSTHGAGCLRTRVRTLWRRS